MKFDISIIKEITFIPFAIGYMKSWYKDRLLYVIVMNICFDFNF